ncbi:CLUMA_CG004871, isoform A [Clunio marinus]|uniref:CLUMA_CG004871, isoform A n=1 Tax=Clunio marinus TaxID=568069 RepID=A0A1J1HV03_9DIPT|nr:CLUMA_CG004871, isoform A [Clunio marinus]
MNLRAFYKSLTRKKPMVVGESKLKKFLSTVDLTAMGVGSTLGVGVYVLAGEVSKNVAGPGVILSFAIAAFASVLAGLCYAEFGARVPKAGSAYIYSFVTIGEFVAFLIGWNLILEYAIGSASVSKGITNYIDEITGNRISNFWIEIVPISVPFFGRYADFFALGIIIVVSLGLAFGAKESALMNNVFTITNISIVLFVIICGFFKMDFSNWAIPAEQVPEGAGTGGFFPYGFVGVVKGAAICFYAFIGFDVIATAGEEARNPRKSIPISICLSLFIIFLAYFGISSVLTLMVPYYDQNENAPLPAVFRSFEWPFAEYLVTFGAIFGMFASLMGAMFPLPRVIYAIAVDGLLFDVFARVHYKFNTPFWGTLIAGVLTGSLAAFFDLDQLINMMSIGTFMAYSMVAACVLLLRYEVDSPQPGEKGENMKDERSGFINTLFNIDGLTIPTKYTSGLVTIIVTLYAVFCMWMSLVISLMGGDILEGDALAIVLLCLPIVAIIISMIILVRQPKSAKILTFSVPFVPWFPALSIMVNIYLMVELDTATWIRFGVWIAIGLVIYIFYGRRYSKEKEREMLANTF